MIPSDLLNKLREKDPEPFPPIQFKVCTKCHISKPVTEFGIIKRDNCLKSWCKECCKNHCTQKRREQGILPQKGCKRSEEFKKRASEANYKNGLILNIKRSYLRYIRNDTLIQKSDKSCLNECTLL